MGNISNRLHQSRSWQINLCNTSPGAGDRRVESTNEAGEKMKLLAYIVARAGDKIEDVQAEIQQYSEDISTQSKRPSR